MRTTFTTKYNPYVPEMPDDIFLLDEEFDQFDRLEPSFSKIPRFNEFFN